MNLDFSRALMQIDNMYLPLKPFLNFTCFRLQPEGMENQDELNRLNEAFLDEINKGGKLFLTHTKIDGLYTLRMLIGQTYVNEDDVKNALDQIKEAATILN